MATEEQELQELQELRELRELSQMRQKSQAATMEETPTAADFARGVSQGATMGFGDELTGLVGGALDPSGLRPMVEEGQQSAEALRTEAAAQNPNAIAAEMRAQGFSDDEIAQQLDDLARFQEAEGPSSYGVYRDRARRLQEEARERSPIATGLGEAAGAIGSGAITGAASIPALAAEGALFGLGGAEGSAGQQLKSAAIGGATSGALGAAGRGLGGLFDRAKQALGRSAERQAVKALQPTKGQLKKIFDEKRMGRALLDDDVVGAFKSPGKMARAALSEEKKLAKDLDIAYDAMGGVGVPREDVAMKLAMRAEDLSEEAANKPIVKKILEFADEIQNKKSVLKPKDIRKQRRAVDNVTNFNSDAPTQQANKAIRDTLRNIEDDVFTSQGMGKDFVDLKRRFGDITDARQILEDASAREKSGTLKELIKRGGLGIGAGAIGATTQDPYIGGAAALLGMGGRAFGRGGAAKVMDRISKSQAPNAVPTINRIIQSQSQNPYLFE